MEKRQTGFLAALMSCALLASCSRPPPPATAAPAPAPEPVEPAQTSLVVIAGSERQWTGLAISKEGRAFVCYPRWSEALSPSVEELQGEAPPKPYPNEHWNLWDIAVPPRECFVCVQSLVVDPENCLWILDAANPRFAGVVKDGPKLLRVDLTLNEVVQRIYFDESAAPPDAYLNDVRVDTQRGCAYITDSGRGALVVVNLWTGRSRRVLENHPSTRSEGLTLVIGGKPWKRPDGSLPQVHADGLALDAAGEYLYYQALTGRSLYRIATRYLRDENFPVEELGNMVQLVGHTGAADGIMFGPDGMLYLSALEEGAIKRLTPDGRVETVIQDARISWPDSFAIGPDGSVLFTTSQIHLGKDRAEPYRIFRIVTE